MKKISAIILAGSMGLAAQAQIIDTLNGDSLAGYTATLVNDGGVGTSLSYSDSSGALVASYVGTNTTPEQGLLLAPANSFSTTFAVGDILTINTAVPISTTTEDFGLAISSTATPPAALGNSTRANFDWASISLRPSQNAIRANSSISGTLVTGNGVVALGGGGTPTVSELFIEWNSANVFTLGYVNGSGMQTDETLTFAPTSTIGSAIGFYADLRATGTSLGSFSDLTIATIPEPTSLALCGMGLAGLWAMARRKK